MYSFIDLYYRHVGTNGLLFADMEDSKRFFMQSSQQIGANMGFGFKIKIVKWIILSPEIFLDLYHASTKTYTYSAQSAARKSTSSSDSGRPGIRIFLAVRL